LQLMRRVRKLFETSDVSEHFRLLPKIASPWTLPILLCGEISQTETDPELVEKIQKPRNSRIS
jgi:hypothetical protein